MADALAEPQITAERLGVLVETAQHLAGVYTSLPPEVHAEIASRWVGATRGIPAPFVERAFREWAGPRMPSIQDITGAAAEHYRVARLAADAPVVPLIAASEIPDEPFDAERARAQLDELYAEQAKINGGTGSKLVARLIAALEHALGEPETGA